MRAKYTCPFCLIFIFALISRSSAQQSWFRADTITAVTAAGNPLVSPWAGGFNAPQFLKMHLNNDADEDLVVYDRTNSKVSTYLTIADPANAGKKTYKHAPYYESLFPQADNWMILADYDGDGHKDLFTSTSLGITVYKNVRAGTSWLWQLQRNVLYTKGFSGNINMQVSGTDIPGITDIDGDGDLDLLTFDFSGTYIELHQNMSMERFGVPDSLGTQQAPVFMRNGDCWGNFHKGNAEGFEFGSDCGVVAGSEGGRIMHAGNSILLHDLNGDGKKDLLVGHVSNEHISFLTNSTSGLAANFTAYSNIYPPKDPVLMHIFPAAFYEDVDFDGVKDLLTAPSIPSNDMNQTDFKASAWVYHNAGTNIQPVFNLVKKNFLQDQMIDVGENAAPCFADIDGDGDLDLLVGTGGNPGTGGFKGGIVLYKNTGTATEPNFTLDNQNYLEIATKLSAFNIKPQWADFNGDGVPDLGFAATALSNLRFEYRYIPNKAPAGAPPQLNIADAVTVTMPAESQSGDSPYFYDTDGDGDLDLLVGKGQGNIFHYLNTGTNKQFVFTLQTDAFAGVALNFAGRFPGIAVADFDLDGQPDLASVDHTGTLRIFNKAAFGKWAERTADLIEVNGKPAAPVMGNYLSIAVADLNGDKKPDVAVGTNAGGVRLFRNILPITITGVEPNALDFKVYPNPSTDHIKVHSAKAGTLNVVTAGGVTLLKNLPLNSNSERVIPTRNWTSGLYLIEFQVGDSRIVKKVIVE